MVGIRAPTIVIVIVIRLVRALLCVCVCVCVWGGGGYLCARLPLMTCIPALRDGEEIQTIVWIHGKVMDTFEWRKFYQVSAMVTVFCSGLQVYKCWREMGENKEIKCMWNKENNNKFATFNKQKQKPTTPGIPRRSPIQVLTGPDAAWLRWSDENRYIQRGMVVGKCSCF